MTHAISNGEQPIYTASEPESTILLDLIEPQSRITVRVSDGVAGRAEARFGGRSWAAKHYWREGDPGAEVTIFEFDEPLPAGRVVLHVPITRAGA